MNLISLQDTARKLGVCPRTLHRITDRDETFPRKKKPFGQKAYYVLEEVDQWLENAMSENA